MGIPDVGNLRIPKTGANLDGLKMELGADGGLEIGKGE